MRERMRRPLADSDRGSRPRDGLLGRSAVHGSTASGFSLPAGTPLRATTRQSMESLFGHDFSQVRVHADEHAAEAAQGLSARAFTVGKDISFGLGRYAPDSLPGQRLLAHELTHVVQQIGPSQRHLRAPARTINGGQADSLEAEASQIANQFTPLPSGGSLPSNPIAVRQSTAPGVQRAVDTEAEQEQLAPRSHHYNPWEAIVEGASTDRASLTESPVSLEYDWLHEANRQDLKDWQEFREGDYDMLPMPGVRSAGAALNLKMALQTKAKGQITQSHVTTQLRKRYTDQEFAELSAIARWAGTIPNTRGAAALGDLLGVSSRPTRHTYEFNIRWDWAAGTNVGGGESSGPGDKGAAKRSWGSPMSVGYVFRAAKVRYSNPDLGMSYTVDLDIHSGKAGASLGRGASIGSGQDGGAGIDYDQIPPGGDEIINAVRGTEEKWLPAAAAPGTFWRPDDFAGGFSVFSGKASAKIQVLAWSAKPVSATFFELFSFSKGSEILVFAVPEAAESGERKANDAEASRQRMLDALLNVEATTDRSKLAEVAAGAGLEFEAGWASINGVEYEATAPEFEASDRQEGWFLLRDTEIFFDTGSYDVTSRPANLAEINKLAAYIGRYTRVHPDARFQFNITGYSSPLWKGTKDSDSASVKNYDLSSLRATGVHAALLAYKSEMISGGAQECLFEIRFEDLAGLNQTMYDPDLDQWIDAAGSEPAILEGKALDSNDPEDRRVHIETMVKLDITGWI